MRVDIEDAAKKVDAAFGSGIVPDTIHISQWAREVGTVWSLASLQQNTRVVFVEHRKSKSASEHEFIVLIVLCHIGDGFHITRYIRVDRHPSKRIPVCFQLGIKVDAKDTISISRSPFESTRSYSLYRMEFPIHGTGPNMLELTAMLMIVTSMAPQYCLFTSACYWHSRMVFEGLAHIFQGEVSPTEKSHLRRKYAGLVPIVDETGSLLLGNPRALQAWESFQSCIEPDSNPPTPHLAQLHKLFDHMYYRQHTILSSAVQRAENSLQAVQ